MYTALILGASRGIGAEMVRAFCGASYRVIFTYNRDALSAKALSDETGALGIQADIGDENQMLSLKAQLESQFSHLDALIVNAGISHYGLLQDSLTSDWDQLMQTNLFGAYLSLRLFYPLLAKKGGSALLISSIWGRLGASCEAIYAASKAGLHGLALSLAKEWGPQGIRVNILSPGVIETDMIQHLSTADLDALRQETALKRLGKASEVAKAALFLSGEEASFITGQVLGVDGGFPA